MKKIRSLYLLSSIVLLLALISSSFRNPGKSVLDIYVSPAGNDRWSGLKAERGPGNQGPLATPGAAVDLIRRLRQDGELTDKSTVLHFSEGTYFLSKPLELSEKDGGPDPLSMITWKAEGIVRFTAGKLIGKWERVSDPGVLSMLPTGTADRIRQARLPDMEENYLGSPEGGGAELFFNDQPMHVSRYPNKGYMKITALFNIDPVDIRGTKGDRIGKFVCDDKRISRWKDEKDGWVHGYWFWDWSEQRHRIASIDAQKQVMEVEPPYHSYGYRIGQWFYGFNLLSETDEPEEYYLDRQKGIVYFFPPSDPGKGSAYVSAGKGIMSLHKVRNLTIRGIIMEGCRGSALEMRTCENVSVSGCTIRNCGESAVVILNSLNCGARACEIYNTGAGGIRIEAGDRRSLSPGNCFADNNYIHDIARLRRVYYPGISISGVANRITHNVIARVPHMAVGFMGNDHLIEYNEIDSACYESNDAGAIYTGRNWTMRGNIIRYNYLHDISGFEGKGCVGIYLDDAFSSAEITGNIFRNVTRAMMIGGGRDNKVLNNIFIACTPSIHVDARGLGWMKNEHIPGWLESARDSGLIQGVAYNKPPYSTRYPELVNITIDEPRAPKGNVISRNICLGGVWDKAAGFWSMAIEDKARPYLRMEDNIVAPGSLVEDPSSRSFIIADPLFENEDDPAAAGYRLRPDSPAFRHGFVQIPFDSIGLYPDPDRR